MQVLQECITALDALVSRTLAPLPQSNLSAPFMRWALQHDQIELCTELLARVEPGSQQLALKQIGEQSQERCARYFAGSDQTMITAMASEDFPLIVLATTNPRRQIERRYLERFCDAEELTDEPSLIEAKPTSQWSMAEGAVVFRVGSVLASDYFLTVDVGLGRLSHDLPALIESEHQPARLILDPHGPTFGLIVGLYADDYPMFGSMVKDFVRNVVFPLVSELVPSSTREGAEAFLKSIRRTRDYFEYEAEDLLSLTEIWDEFREGKISVDEATQRSIGAGLVGASRSSSLARPRTLLKWFLTSAPWRPSHRRPSPARRRRSCAARPQPRPSCCWSPRMHQQSTATAASLPLRPRPEGAR
jgi:molecular chaperone HtpG